MVSGVAGEWVVVDAPLSSCSTAACLFMTLCLLVAVPIAVTISMHLLTHDMHLFSCRFLIEGRNFRP